MKRKTYFSTSILVCSIAIFALMILLVAGVAMARGHGHGLQGKAPVFEVDPFWPKPLPDDMLVGQVPGIAVDQYDHIWIVQRPRSLTVDEAGADETFEGTGTFATSPDTCITYPITNAPPRSECCFPAPSVIEFDRKGNMVQAWGGPGWDLVNDEYGESMMKDPKTGDIVPWLLNEHGIFVDHNMNVWLGGNSGADQRVLKFSSTGKLLLVIGIFGETGGDCDFERLGQPADTEVDPETNEVYIADGYGNHRIIVFDADTGDYIRHWFADGVTACDEGEPVYDGVIPYNNPVHAVRIAKDGLVYVADRAGERIQVFDKNIEPGQPGFYVEEISIRPATLGNGSTWDLDVSHDKRQTFLYNADGENNHIDVLRRKPLEHLYYFGRNGRNAGQFHWLHNLAVDSKGNMYTAEVDTGKRIQKFKFKGFKKVDKLGKVNWWDKKGKK